MVIAGVVSSIKSSVLAAIVYHPRGPLTHTKCPGCQLRWSQSQWQWHKGPTKASRNDRGGLTGRKGQQGSVRKSKLFKTGDWGRVPTGLPKGAHVNIQDPSADWQIRLCSSQRDQASRSFPPSTHDHEGHAWRSPHAASAEASTPHPTRTEGSNPDIRLLAAPLL